MEWDRSHQWSVRVLHWHQIRVGLQFDARPSKSEMLACRQLFPELAALPMRTFLDRITSSPMIDMGIRSGIESWRLKEQAVKLGLNLIRTDESQTYYEPFDETLQQGWGSLDSDAAERFAKELIEAGAPVTYIEAD